MFTINKKKFTINLKKFTVNKISFFKHVLFTVNFCSLRNTFLIYRQPFKFTIGTKGLRWPISTFLNLVVLPERSVTIIVYENV